MRKATAITLLGLLAACTSQDIRRNGAEEVFNSPKEKSVVAGCITEKWSRTVTNVLQSPYGDGLTVRMTNGDTIIMQADVLPEGSGSRVRLTSMTMDLSGGFVNDVRNCAA